MCVNNCSLLFECNSVCFYLICDFMLLRNVHYDVLLIKEINLYGFDAVAFLFHRIA